MRSYLIDNDRITVCREAPSAFQALDEANDVATELLPHPLSAEAEDLEPEESGVPFCCSPLKNRTGLSKKRQMNSP